MAKNPNRSPMRAHYAAFRREPIRSRKLLDSARDQPCTMQVPGVCNHDPSTTVSAHIHDETFGFGVKADDLSSVHACMACHNWLDRGEHLGKVDPADVLRIILRAMQRTLRNRIERGFIRIDLDPERKAAEKKTPPRKPKDLRTKIPVGKPLQSRSNWPTGRKLQSGPVGKAKL